MDAILRIGAPTVGLRIERGHQKGVICPRYVDRTVVLDVAIGLLIISAFDLGKRQ